MKILLIKHLDKISVQKKNMDHKIHFIKKGNFFGAEIFIESKVGSSLSNLE